MFVDFKKQEPVMQGKQSACNREIPIIDGRISCGYGIIPVRVIDYTCYKIEEMQNLEISMVMEDVFQYLEPFLLKHFDNELEANKTRCDYTWIDDEGNKHIEYVKSLWGCYDDYFFTIASMKEILNDIKYVVEIMSSGEENEFTDRLVFDKKITQEQISEIKTKMPKAVKAETEMIIDFYRRFCKKMENMIEIAQKTGHELIMFMSP